MNVPPEHIKIQTSSLPLAGRGAFTSIDLPAEHNVGEYTGKLISFEEAEQKTEKRYFMGVRDDSGQLLHIIDGSEPGSSGWLRYINTAYTKRQANIFPRTIDKRVYYYTNRAVAAGEELLSYYGDEYTTKLKEKLATLGVQTPP